MALLISALPGFARQHHSASWADSQFSAAQHLHESLEQRPAEERSRHDYQRVLDAYRRVYMSAPSCAKADPSVVAVGQLLEEMGRRFNDDELLRSAIHQYEFLRRQYPGSKARFDALFRIGEIYREDLHDKTRADATFTELVRRYPRNPLAAEARKMMAEPAGQAEIKPNKSAKTPEPANDADDDSDQQARTEPPSTGKTVRVTGIRHWSTPEYTRVAIDLEQSVHYESQRIDNPDRVFFDLLNTRPGHGLDNKTFDVDDGFLRKIRISQYQPGRTRVVLETDEFTDFTASLEANPPRLIVDVHNRQLASNSPGPASAEEDDQPEPAPEARKTGGRSTVIGKDGVKKTIVDADYDPPAEEPTVKDAASDATEIAPPPTKLSSTSSASQHVKSTTSRHTTPPPDLDIREAQPTASGDRSLTRVLGLKIGKIVIDPGHGGHDTGTIGPNGLEEKDLVLDVSRRLGKLLQTRLGADVIYTRKDDTFIPLETRTAIANQEAADLFVSVHANSSGDPDARGVETYYLNFTSSPDALEVAARENAVSEESIHQLQDLVKKIALKEKIDESREFAGDVEASLHSGLSVRNPGLRDRGVKKAPFIVLIGANMPSILAEISFVSNPGDERRLRTADYRQRIAESLYRGIAKYAGGLGGVKVASRMDKSEGQ